MNAGTALTDRIPPELVALPRWVAYKEEVRNGKPTKAPYRPARPERRASHSNPETWGSFELALAASEAGTCDGVGIVLGEIRPGVHLAGIDLDKCRDARSGQIHPAALEIIRGVNSYAEVSPSLTGVKVFAYGTLPGGGRKTYAVPWGGALELYDRLRYFTVTGKGLNGSPRAVLVRSEVLAGLYQRFFPPAEEPAQRTVPSVVRNLDDRALLDRALAARNAARFSRLWNGDPTAYGSLSEADLALCTHLAFWWGRDPAAIDRMFRRSGLMRKKWEREDYRERTIAKAIARCRDVYTPPPEMQEPVRKTRVRNVRPFIRATAAAVALIGGAR